MIEVLAGVARDESLGDGRMDETQIVRPAAERGATVEETAAEFGCSEATARRLWRDLALPGRPPRGRRRRVPGTLAEVERELRAGRRTTEVARARGVSVGAIRDMAQRHGFPLQALRRSAGWGVRRSGSAADGGG